MVALSVNCTSTEVLGQHAVITSKEVLQAHYDVTIKT